MAMALIKSVALGYLLGAVALSLAALWWRWLRLRLPGHQRAAAGFALLGGALGLNALLTLAICLAVVCGAMPMTTGFFHRLMYGGWAAAITGCGWLLLGVSLTICWAQWRRGRLPRPTRGEPTAGPLGIMLPRGLRARFTEATPRLCLAGAWRPELWLNPGFWQGLNPAERELAVAHELRHLARRDNLRRLVLEALSALYFALPWARGWAAGYELDSELAVDHACRQIDETAYARLIARIMAQQLALARLRVAASHLSAQAQTVRLQALAAPAQRGSAAAVAAWTVLGIACSQALAALLLSHSVTRCLLTCFLGY